MGLKRLENCLICGSKDLSSFLSLGAMPLTDCYVEDAKKSIDMQFYRLEMKHCSECNHVQQGYITQQDESYSHYRYSSAITTGLATAFDEYAKFIIARKPKGEICLLDIGSNDGSFMKACDAVGIRTYGIEPSQAHAHLTNKAGYKTMNAYFTDNIKERLVQSGFPSRYDVITFNNVLANLDSPVRAVETARNILAQGGFIIIQTGYHPLQFAKGLFDYAYHEHLSFFSLDTLKIIAEKNGMYICDYTVNELRGGTVRAVLRMGKSSSVCIDERFTTYNELCSLQYLASASAQYTREILSSYKRAGRTVIGYGASHSTGVLVHSFGIESWLDFLVDENEGKHGLFMPGTELEVKSVEEIMTRVNCCIIVLAWQYYANIREKLVRNGFTGPIIKPVLP